MGFTLASDKNSVVYFSHDNCSFLLQDFYNEIQAHNFMMHLLVEDVASWHELIPSGSETQFLAGMMDFCEGLKLMSRNRFEQLMESGVMMRQSLSPWFFWCVVTTE